MCTCVCVRVRMCACECLIVRAKVVYAGGGGVMVFAVSLGMRSFVFALLLPVELPFAVPAATHIPCHASVLGGFWASTYMEASDWPRPCECHADYAVREDPVLPCCSTSLNV
eukprot:scpid90505/ scgid22614/ 